MIKKLLTVLNVFAFITVFGQSGIGTHTPEGALDINSPNKDWGLVLPHVDQAENTKNPTGKAVKKATIVYDLKENCIRYFNGAKWSGCLATAPITNPFVLNCSAAVLNKDIIANSPITAGTTVFLPYSNTGDEFAYNGMTISSTNVTGLQAVLAVGSIKKGAGNLAFSITGTPSTYGVAKFALSIAGVNCEFVVTVKNYTDIETPIANLICEKKDQLTSTTLKGEHMINGKKVMVTYTVSSPDVLSTNTINCGAAVAYYGFWLGNQKTTTLSITFSRPVTNVGVSFITANRGEEFVFAINNNKPIQLRSISTCSNMFNITDNKVTVTGNTGDGMGGNLTVGGRWFTELTITHNGQGNGAIFGFCLNSSDAM